MKLKISILTDNKMDNTQEKTSNNILLRTISGIFIASSLIFAIVLGFPYFHYLIALISGFIFFEWRNVSLNKSSITATMLFVWAQYYSFECPGSLLAVVLAAFLLFLIFYILNKPNIKNIIGYIGIIYIFISISLLSRIYNYGGILFMLWLFFTIWITDTGAFFFGKLFGKTKFAPSISPKKTWEGVIGGTFFSVLIIPSLWFLQSNDIKGYSKLVTLTFITSICSHIGDLIESAAKRYFGVKDMGNTIPGHGGFADRFDSLLFVSIIVYIVVFCL